MSYPAGGQAGNPMDGLPETQQLPRRGALKVAERTSSGSDCFVVTELNLSAYAEDHGFTHG